MCCNFEASFSAKFCEAFSTTSRSNFWPFVDLANQHEMTGSNSRPKACIISGITWSNHSFEILSCRASSLKSFLAEGVGKFVTFSQFSRKILKYKGYESSFFQIAYLLFG